MSLLEYFLDPDSTSKEDVRKSMEWLCEKPEIIDALEEAYLVHKKPLKVIVDEYVPMNGYNCHTHEIEINPEGTFGHGGDPDRLSFERIMAHEIKHASQADIRKYENARRLIITLLNEYGDETPRKKYANRINTAKGVNELSRVFEEIFDKEIEPTRAQRDKALRAEMMASEPIQQYFSAIEKPAIEFDNLIMSKYHGELCRKLDYNECVQFRPRAQYVREWVDEELHRREMRALRKLKRTSATVDGEQVGR